MEANVGKMATQFQQPDTKLNNLTTKTEKASSAVKIDFRKRVDDLEAKRRITQSKLDEFWASGTEKWKSFRVSVGNAWSEMKINFKELKR